MKQFVAISSEDELRAAVVGVQPFRLEEFAVRFENLTAALPNARQILFRIATNPSEQETDHAQAMSTLSRLGGEEALMAFQSVARDTRFQYDQRYYAVQWLSCIQCPEAVRALEEVIFNGQIEEGIRRAAVSGLARFSKHVDRYPVLERVRQDMSIPKSIRARVDDRPQEVETMRGDE